MSRFRGWRGIMEIVIGFLISLVGFAYLTYGKKTTDFIFIVFGTLLMIYPYFMQGKVISLLIGTFLLLAPFILKSVV